MRKTTNYGFVLYDPTDKMNITGSENSLNASMEKLDEVLKNIADKSTGGGSSTGNVWLGTEAEYTIALGNGTITSSTICLITDEEGETTTIIQNGDILEIYNGVTVTQNNDELEVK